MLAGCAPLHAERLAARGGPAEAIHDPLAWFDTSSYGAAHARLDAAHGRRRPARARLRPPGRSRRPTPSVLGDAVEHALTIANPERVLGATGGAGVNAPELDRVRAGPRASRPQLWSHLVEHDRAARSYSELLRNDDVAAWLICWMDEQDTGFHDHDVSAGAVAVVSGSVREDRLVLGAAPSSRVRRPPAARSPSRPRTSTASSTRAPSRRSRSTPTRRRCGGWAPTRSSPSGRLLRHSVSYAEELQPAQPRGVAAASGERQRPFLGRSTLQRRVQRPEALAALGGTPRPTPPPARPCAVGRTAASTASRRRRPTARRPRRRAAPRRTRRPRRRRCARAAARAPRRRSRSHSSRARRRRPTRGRASGSAPSSAIRSSESRSPKATPSSTARTSAPRSWRSDEPGERAARVRVGVRRALAGQVGQEREALDPGLPRAPPPPPARRSRAAADRVAQPAQRARRADSITPIACHVVRHRVAERVHARLRVGRERRSARRTRRPRCRARPTAARPRATTPTPSAPAAWSPAPAATGTPSRVSPDTSADSSARGSHAPVDARAPRTTSSLQRRCGDVEQQRAARRRRRRSRARRTAAGARSPWAAGCARSARRPRARARAATAASAR